MQHRVFCVAMLSSTERSTGLLYLPHLDFLDDEDGEVLQAILYMCLYFFYKVNDRSMEGMPFVAFYLPILFLRYFSIASVLGGRQMLFSARHYSIYKEPFS